MSFKSYKFVVVYWRDAWSEDSWQTIDAAVRKIKLGERCKVCGWLFYEDDERIAVAQCIGMDFEGASDVGNIWIVPRGMVETIIEVPEPGDPREDGSKETTG